MARAYILDRLEFEWSLVPNPVFVLALPQNHVISVVFNVLLFSALGRQSRKHAKNAGGENHRPRKPL